MRGQQAQVRQRQADARSEKRVKPLPEMVTRTPPFDEPSVGETASKLGLSYER